MPIEIIPTILVDSLKDFIERIKVIEHHVKTVQIDIADGKFVPNTNFGDPQSLKEIKTNLKIEVHLMTVDPIERVEEWKEAGVSRIIFHYETCRGLLDLTRTIKAIKDAGLEVGIAVNPKTSVDSLRYIVDNIDEVLLLAVEPGKGGQKFKKIVLKKIKKLKSFDPNVNIGVDGGITPKEAKLVVKAGANFVCAGSFIFGGKSVRQAISLLKKAVSL